LSSNHEVIAVDTNQIAGKPAHEAAEKARKRDYGEAARSIRSATAAVQSLFAPKLTGRSEESPRRNSPQSRFREP
jgi:DNA polymerase/3'-5' exonuclease PolX